MRRVFDVDVLRCHACRARRRLVALITSRPVIEPGPYSLQVLSLVGAVP